MCSLIVVSTAAAVLLQISKLVWCLQCYECSDFPREPGSQDEALGKCPGWKRPAKYFGLSSLYDGCMTVKLAYNGSVLAQNAVIYSQCLQYQKDVPISLRPHSELEVRISCCRESKCNAPKKYRWNQQILLQQQEMDDQRESIANLPSLLLPKGLPSSNTKEKALDIDNRMQHQTEEQCNNLKHYGHQTVLVDHMVVGQNNPFHSEADDRKWQQTSYISPSLSSSMASTASSGRGKLTPTTLFLLLQVMLLLA